MLCFVAAAIGYIIYWLSDTVLLRLAFNLRTDFGKKLLWYADVLAYIAAALVVSMFVGLVSIKSTYALFI